ncbi:MAG: hypothetical protein JNK11_02615 [Alphaproteobacteria bacterium]|nr:hypothetical protein [Alphaproteobacteria bacterium]
MIITRLLLRDFKKLTGTVEIAGLGPGIAVVAGENEEGKSTLLAALRSAFFDRHKLGGDAAQALLPDGRPGAAPEVAVDFTVGGKDYALRKVFVRGALAELRAEAVTLAGAEAEEEVQRLLRFEPPQRGASEPAKHHGAFGLLWLEQGRAFAQLAVNDQTRQTLRESLTREVGEVTGGERGRLLLAAVEAEHAQLFTANGKLRKERQALRDEATAAEGEATELRRRLLEAEADVDALVRVRDRLQGFRRDGTEASLQRHLDDAAAEMKKTERLRADLRQKEMEAKVAEAERQGPAGRLAERKRLVAALAEAEKAAAAVAAEMAEAAPRRARLESEAHAAAEALRAARAGVEAAERALDLARLRHDAAQIEKEKAALADRHGRARAAREAELRARAAVKAVAVDAQAVATMRDLDRAIAVSSAGLDTGATVVTLDLPERATPSVDGTAVEPKSTHRVVRETLIDLGKAGKITVAPGAGALGDRDKLLAGLRERQATLLRNCGVADLAAAEEALQRRRQLEQEAATQAALRESLAPEGLDPLAQALAESEARLATLAAATAAGDGVPLSEAEAAARKARDARDRAEHAEAAARKQAAEAREAALTLESNAQRARKDAEAAGTRLAAERHAEADDALEAAATSAALRSAGAKEAVEAATAVVRRADPEAAEERLKAAKEALRVFKQELATLERRESELGAAMRARGEEGLGERLELAEGAAARAQAIVARAEREERAVQLLADALRAAERTARERYLAPIQARVRPYLNQLFPDAELLLDDGDLSIAALRRGGEPEAFARLSVGTREQIAVIVRLAFADLLAETGEPTPIVLDDPLVNTDDGRMEAMRRILLKAARRHQIIVLTCRERDYRPLGSRIIRLTDSRRAAA